MVNRPILFKDRVFMPGGLVPSIKVFKRTGSQTVAVGVAYTRYAGYL